MFVFPSNAWPKRYWPTGYWPASGDAPPLTTLPDRSWVNGFYALILVGNPDGVLIGELAAGIEAMSTELNHYGQTKLSLAPSGNEHLIEFGNRMLIYVDNGLPPWAGFIDPPRGWKFAQLSLTAYSGERLLAHRVTGRNRAFSQVSAASVLAALLAEQDGPAVVERGTIDSAAGMPVTETYHWHKLLEVAQDDLMAGVDFHVSGVIVDGRIQFRLNVYARRGRDLADVWLLEGHNAILEPEEQGPLVNEWFSAGTGSDWGDTGRLYGRARDEVSIGRFGLRQDTKVFTSAKDQHTLDALTAAEVDFSGQPYVAVSVDALNLAPALFAQYDIGDGVGVELYSMMGGYRGLRRVVGRDWRPASGVCTAVLI
jgi:hypothetical protein